MCANRHWLRVPPADEHRLRTVTSRAGVVTLAPSYPGSRGELIGEKAADLIRGRMGG